MIFPPVYSSTGGVPHRSSHRLEKSWSKNRPERSEHATGVEPAGDHQWWAVFLTYVEIMFTIVYGKKKPAFHVINYFNTENFLVNSDTTFQSPKRQIPK